MADVNTDEEERRAAVDGSRSRGVALADEGPDELPALLALAVGVAIIAITIAWPAIRDVDTGPVAAPIVAADGTEDADGTSDDAGADDEEPEDEPGPEDEPEAALPDIPAIEAGLAVAGLTLSADGNTVVVEGVVPDEDTRSQIVEFVGSQPNVDAVDDRLTIEAPAAAAAVDVEAAQVSIVLQGTVPDEATRAALVERAVAVYSEAQVDDQLVVDAAAAPPVTVTIGGSMTDPVLYDQVLTAFVGVDGVELATPTLTLAESSEVESSLNNLEPIEFASGSALVEAASAPILDQAAEFLIANPDVAIEIGGHTDSRGSDASNEALSQARAEAVLAELQARGVENEMTAVGFGERRLKEDPDDTPEAQRTNRRIEFRITNS